MGLLLLVVGAGAIAFLVGRSWAITIPLAAGVILGAAVLAVGGSLEDTPLPFVTGLGTIAAASAILARRRLTPI